jgi:electron transport complex protein RnfD
MEINADEALVTPFDIASRSRYSGSGLGAFYQKSHVSLVLSTRVRMIMLSCAALLVVLQSSLSDGGASLVVAAASLGAAVASEALVGFARKRQTISDCSACVSGLVLALLLPNKIPPVIAAAGAVFAVVLVKQCSGGLGANWLNPALGGALFVRFSWSQIWDSALGSSTLNGAAINLASDSITDTTLLIASFVSQHINRILSVNIPSQYINLFSFTESGIIADRGILALIVCSIIISAAFPHRSFVPFLFLASYAFLVRFAGGLPSSGIFPSGDMFYALCSGGIFAAAFFLLADPVTGPKSNFGCILYSLCAALLSFIFRFQRGDLFGVYFAIALLNTFIPLFREAERKFKYERRRKSWL